MNPALPSHRVDVTDLKPQEAEATLRRVLRAAEGEDVRVEIVVHGEMTRRLATRTDLDGPPSPTSNAG
jgi:DNA-nicking Smr family endonuclease